MSRYRGPTNGIIGLGEVGTAIAELYAAAGIPVGKHDPYQGCEADPTVWDVVHVCVPARAVGAVIASQTRKRALVIVHSTVPVGTCEGLWRQGHRVCHAPIRGIHPYLAEGIRTFKMPVSGAHPDDRREAIQTLHEIGITAVDWGAWQNTELAKLLSTTEYGVLISWMRHVGDLCRKFGADFDLVYKAWHAQYNEGYFTLGYPQFMRTTLEPVPGKIGGHCVLPNADILAPDSEWAARLAFDGRKEWVPPPVCSTAEG